MQYSDDNLDIDAQRLNRLERELEITRDLLETTIASVKDTQRYLMKLAYNQSEITKRVSQWPYLVVYPDKDDN